MFSPAGENPSLPRRLRRAGISVGAAHPALQRLLRRGLLIKGKAGARGRSEYRLTKAGREALKSWTDLLQTYQDQVPSDVESVLRVVALAYCKGKKREGLELLHRALAARARAGGTVPTRPNVPGNKSTDMGAFYQSLIATVENGRIEGERQALRQLVARLQRGPK